ncbi:hypothetical protein KR093_009805 [Drosophila rubida]|uniref:Uncharacterized protein n=1 Tax=Drosophila rubida TaxID=30044 RepID=A0AAD4JYQ6_9MUSC|nr:hypothetical protein KR093_009805 [Drosophila rubida]
MFSSNFGNHSYTRLPTSSAALKSLEVTENAIEESALEFYENCNIAWRAQFTDPTLAAQGIGTQFQPLKSGKKEKSSQNSANAGDTDSENNQSGNVTYRVFHQPGLLEFLPEIGSDFENIVPYVVVTRH